jgi:hypothetical protein
MLFNADKLEAAVRTKPVLLPSDEFMCPPETTALPLELYVVPRSINKIAS